MALVANLLLHAHHALLNVFKPRIEHCIHFFSINLHGADVPEGCLLSLEEFLPGRLQNNCRARRLRCQLVGGTTNSAPSRCSETRNTYCK